MLERAEELYACARLGNVLFFAGALFLIFRVALRCAGRHSRCCVDGRGGRSVRFARHLFHARSDVLLGFWFLAWLLLRIESAPRLGSSQGSRFERLRW